MSKRRDVKKFLIVVAIIAVLVAIAVPLFVGQLDKAKQATYNANARAIKAEAITALLSNEGNDLTDVTKVYAKATVDASGNISGLTLSKTGTAPDADAYKTWEAGDEITVEITNEDLKDKTLGS